MNLLNNCFTSSICNFNKPKGKLWNEISLKYFYKCAYLYTNKTKFINNQTEAELSHEELLKSELSQGVNFNAEQWDTLSKQLINKELLVPGLYVNNKNIQGVILRLCNDFQLFDVGRLYFKNISCHASNLSSGIVSRYLSLCVQDKKYAAENEDEILGLYQSLRKSSILEPIVAERCIEAICLFEKYWEESFVVLEEIKTVTNPTLSSYTIIIEACFQFGNLEKGWELLRYLTMNLDYKPSPRVILAYIKHCTLSLQNGNYHDKLLNDLFEFLEEFHLRIPNIEVLENLEKFVFSLSTDKFRWSLKETYIPRNALCSVCKRILEPVNISQTEFQELRRLFVKKAIIGSNVFLNSTPHELSKFQSFIEKSQPYDIVVDGLNVAYATGKSDKVSHSIFLKEVVNHFVKKNMKVIVLGRKHMLKWPPQQMNAIQKSSNVFLANNVSQDDPLLLYAALKGGENTYFISRDFMRSHMFLLEDTRVKLLFKKWLISHQYVLGHFSSIYQPVIYPPLPYRPTAQKLALKEPELCWHIPYDEEYQPINPTRKAPWLCVRREPINT